MTDEQYETLGKSIVHFLGLKPNKITGRYDTEWGDKTLVGIGRCVERCVNDVASVVI